MLETLRKKIDNVDKGLILLIAERVKLVKEVGTYKKHHNIPPLDPARWNTVLESRKKMAKAKGIHEQFIKKIFEAIHEEALRIENEV